MFNMFILDQLHAFFISGFFLSEPWDFQICHCQSFQLWRDTTLTYIQLYTYSFCWFYPPL